jgi:hypothetical protein
MDAHAATSSAQPTAEDPGPQGCKPTAGVYQALYSEEFYLYSFKVSLSPANLKAFGVCAVGLLPSAPSPSAGCSTNTRHPMVCRPCIGLIMAICCPAAAPGVTVGLAGHLHLPYCMTCPLLAYTLTSPETTTAHRSCLLSRPLHTINWTPGGAAANK